MKERTGFVGPLTQNYERRLGPAIFRPWALELVSRIEASGRVALDLACGTGLVAAELRGFKTVGLDISPDMLSFAIGRADELVLGSADRLPFSSSIFDLVSCQFGWMFFTDPEFVANELHRVLRPDGEVWISVWGSVAQNPVTNFVEECARRLFPNETQSFFEVPFRFQSGEPIVNTLTAAGFSHTTTEQVEIEVTFSSADEMVRSFVEGNNYLLKTIDRHSVETERVIEQFLTWAIPTFGPGPICTHTCGHLIKAIK